MSLAYRLHKLSLRWQISILVTLAILIALTVMGVMAYRQSRQIVIDMTLDRMAAQTNEIATQLEFRLREVREDVAAIVDFPPIPGIIRSRDNQTDPGTDPIDEGSSTEVWAQRLAKIASVQMRPNPIRLRSELYDQVGLELLRVSSTDDGIRTETDGLGRINIADDFQATKQLGEGEVHVSPITRDVQGNMHINVSTPIRADGQPENESFRGLFVVTLDAARLFDDVMKDSSQSDNETIVEILDEQMQFVFCTANSQAKAFSNQRFDLLRPEPAKWLNEQQATDSGSTVFKEFIASSKRTEAGGESMLGTLKRVYYDPNDHSRYWAVAQSEFGSSALKSVTDLRNSFRLLGLVIALVVMVLTYLAAVKLTEPLTRLSHAAFAISNGEIDTEIPENWGAGEMFYLDRSFREMTDQLREQVHSAEDQQSRTRAIMDSTADAIVTLSEDATILTTNAATETLFGYSAAQLQGKSVSMICPALTHRESSSDNAVLAAGEIQSMGPEVEVTGRRQDGTEFTLALRVAKMNHAGEQLFIATLQDIEDRKQSERERERLFVAIRDAVQRLSTSSQQILATTSEQASGAQQQAATVSQVVATAEEISQSAAQAADRANEVARSARYTEEVGADGLKSIEGSVSSMNEVRNQVESIAENMLSLAERGQAIEEITATVNDIAEQTNILALNAAIEASRAGEHGKGFAVVAAEVKSLAEQSKKATAQVREILGEIQQATNAAVLSTENGTRTVGEASAVVSKAGETIQSLSRTLADSAKAATQISAAANQQAAGVGQLNEGIRNIDTVSRQNVEAIRQIEQAARNLNGLSNELASLTEI